MISQATAKILHAATKTRRSQIFFKNKSIAHGAGILLPEKVELQEADLSSHLNQL